MPPADIAAVLLFLVIWLFYEPLLPRLAGGKRSLHENMEGIRAAWMRALIRREIRLMDSQFLGHTINSASFFGSANMIAIAALGGFMFGGDASWQGLRELGFVRPGPVWLLEFKAALMLLTAPHATAESMAFGLMLTATSMFLAQSPAPSSTTQLLNRSAALAKKTSTAGPSVRRRLS